MLTPMNYQSYLLDLINKQANSYHVDIIYPISSDKLITSSNKFSLLPSCRNRCTSGKDSNRKGKI